MNARKIRELLERSDEIYVNRYFPINRSSINHALKVYKRMTGRSILGLEFINALIVWFIVQYSEDKLLTGKIKFPPMERNYPLIRFERVNNFYNMIGKNFKYIMGPFDYETERTIRVVEKIEKINTKERPFVAINEELGEEYRGFSIHKFGNKYGVNPIGVLQCLKGKISSYYGWKFKYIV